MHPPAVRFLTKFAVFITMWTVLFGSAPANAAQITVLRDTLTRLQVSTAADHVITFKLPSAVTANQTTTITFSTTTAGQANFSFVSTMSSTRDIDLSTSTAGTSGPFECSDSSGGGAVTYGTARTTTSTVSLPNNPVWGFNTSTSASGQPQIRIQTPSSIGGLGLTSGICYRIRLGGNTANASDASMLTNPASSTATSTQFIGTITYLDVLGGTDSGQFAVGIVSGDQPATAATNTPTMTFEVGVVAAPADCTSVNTTLSTSTLNFYDLRADYVIPTRNILCTRVTSNAGNGVAVQIKSQYGGMTSTRNGIRFPATAVTTAVSTTPTSSSAGLNIGGEHYGACVLSSGVGVVEPASSAVLVTNGYGGGTCTSGIASSAQTLGSENFRKLGTSFDTVWSTTGATYLAYASMFLKAAVSVNTPPDNSYSDTLTVIAFSSY